MHTRRDFDIMYFISSRELLRGDILNFYEKMLDRMKVEEFKYVGSF